MGTRIPRNTGYTADVAANGLSAVQARRTASQFDPSNYTAALSHLVGTGYGAQGANPMYQNWHQSRGFNPQDYAITVGQGNGKYGGFATLGLLKDAVRGQAEILRSADRAQSDQLSELANKYLDQAASMYNDRLHSDAMQTGAPDMGAYRAQAYSRQAADAVGKAQAPANQWLGDTTDPYLSALEMAKQVNSTPLRDYATMAGANYGVDPNVIAGWYPQSSAITDYTQQRDLNAINTYGMTQNEYEQFLAGQQQQGQQADKQATQDTIDYISSVTGYDGNQLSQTLNMTPDQVASLVSDQTFSDYRDRLDAAISSGQSVQSILDEIGAADPQMYGLLFEMYQNAN